MTSLLLLITLQLLAAVIPPADKPCIDLAACATKLCLKKKLIMKKIENATAVDSFDKIVSSFDMICITTKCATQCSVCKSCQYANEQMTAFASGTAMGGMCPVLEGCVVNCVKGEDIPKMIKCVNDKCSIGCYDGGCAACKELSKRIFTRLCREMHLAALPQFADFKATGQCPALFDKLSDEFVAMKKH